MLRIKLRIIRQEYAAERLSTWEYVFRMVNAIAHAKRRPIVVRGEHRAIVTLLPEIKRWHGSPLGVFCS